MKQTPHLWLIISGLLFASVSFAQPQQVHEIQIAPGVLYAHLNFRGWLTATNNYQMTVVAPPAFGTLFGDTYAPTANFWIAGADQVTVDLLENGTSVRHTVLLTPALGGQGSVADEGFEEGFPADWETTGAPNVLNITSDAISGVGSLKGTVNSAGESSMAGEIDPSPTHGATGQSTKVETVASPPGLVASDGFLTLLALGTSTKPQLVRLRNRLVDGTYSVRAQLNEAKTSCVGCPSPWRDIPHNEVMTFTFWSGQSTFGPSGFYPSWGLKLTIEAKPPFSKTEDWIDGLISIERLQIGVDSATGLQNFEATYDNVKTWEVFNYYSPRAFQFDGFEGVGFDPGWSSVGPVAMSSSGSIVGGSSLEIDLDSIETASATADAVLIDASPGGTSTLTAHLRIDASEADLETGESMTLFRGSGLDDLSGDLHLALVMVADGDQHKVKTNVRDNQEVVWNTPWATLSNSAHALVVQWSAGTSDGTLRLWVDGTLIGEVLGLANNQKVVESVAFGAHRAAIRAGVTSGRRVLLDDVVTFY